MNLDVIAVAALTLVLTWLLWFGWTVVRGYVRSRWWRALRVLIAFAVASVVVGALTCALINARTVQLVGDHVTRVDTAHRVVALTFDDGPDDLYVSELIALLKRFDARGTFYVDGAEAAAHPLALRSLIVSGQEIGNHSYRHRRLIFVSTATVRRELEAADAVIREAGFAGRITFRPPQARKLLSLPWVLWRDRRATVMWDLAPDSPSPAGDAAAMARDVADRVRPGSIIQLRPWHPGNVATREALPLILSELRARGYGFVTVSELLDLR